MVTVFVTPAKLGVPGNGLVLGRVGDGLGGGTVIGLYKEMISISDSNLKRHDFLAVL